ncbi:MAG: type II toxin-antitoxin system prevent-host-death family antitoxin [Ornithinimicrobium sp.]
MPTVASRDLRNHTRDVLAKVEDGATVTITVHGRPVARLVPVRAPLRASMTRAEAIGILTRPRPFDSTIDDDMEWIAGGTTDELDPI